MAANVVFLGKRPLKICFSRYQFLEIDLDWKKIHVQRT